MILKNLNQKQFYREFAKYAVEYMPFEWDTAKDDFRPEFKGKNNLLSSFYRYFKIMTEVYKYWKEGSVVIDFGIFPGVLPKIFLDFFPRGNYKYYGTGLAFTPEFVEGMKKINVELWETELDPNYFIPKKVNPIPYRDADLVLFLDTIEHLSNPVYALDTANRVLKQGGCLILTTDNITSVSNIKAILKGKTPLPHPLLTNMFYLGDWRPHFREYGKDDLIWILTHCGFKIEKHEYFDRKQGEYKVCNSVLMRENKNTKVSLKKVGSSFLDYVFSCFPHFNNHQLIIARKCCEIDNLVGKRPERQSELKDWKKMREKYLGY